MREESVRSDVGQADLSSAESTSTTRRPILIANPGSDLYGSDRMLLETVSALVGLGERVIVTTPEEGPLLEQIVQRGGETEIIRTPIIRKSALRPLGMATLIGAGIRGVAPGLGLLQRLRPRLVMINTITAPLWILLARSCGIPVVCHVHEGEASAPRWQRLGLNAPLLLADRLIVNSQFSLDVLTTSLSMLDNRAFVVYNSVPGPATTVKARSTLAEPVRLLYVGRLSARKGPDVAIAAVKALADRGVNAHLDLVGATAAGNESFGQQLRDLVGEYRIDERVTFHGFQRNIWAYSARTDINLVPSTIDEPFGNTAVEAALAARPLIVSRTSGLLEASSDLQACIRVTPASSEEIADAVQTIINYWPDYRDNATRDAKVASDRYSSHRYQASIAEVVADLIDRNSD